MKAFKLLLAFVIAIQYTCWLPAQCATASFSGDGGGVSAQVPVNKIGTLLLADATAFLSESTIEVKTKEQQSSNGQSALQGTVLNSRIVGTGASRHIHGIAFFQGGGSISSLCKKGSRPERVKTSNGEVLEGAISGVTAQGLSIGGSAISAANITCIDSPCAFEFDIPLSGASGAGNVSGEARSISFSQCKVPVSHPAKQVSEGGNGKRIIVCLALAAIVATAIAVPVAVGVSHHHRHHNNNNLTQQQLYLLQTRSVSSGLQQTIANPFSSVQSSSSSSGGSTGGSGGSP